MAVRLTVNVERGKVNEIFGNYMAIRVQQKGEKNKSPDLGEVGRLCAYNRELFFV